MKSVSALLSVAALAVAPSQASALKWKLSSASCNGFPFRQVTLDETCGDADCALGDAVLVTGSVYADRAFYDAPVQLRACLGSWCPDGATADAGTLCDWVTGTQGQQCGEIGKYQVSYDGTVPSDANVPYDVYTYLQGVALRRRATIEIGVGNCGEEGEAFRVATVGLAWAGAAYAAKRRRRRGEEDDDGEREKSSGFV